jgi:hypothetical protein
MFYLMRIYVSLFPTNQRLIPVSSKEFSAVEKKSGLIGDGSLNLCKTVNQRARLYRARMKNISFVDT